MRKIPTVFRRGDHNRRHVTPVVNHECEWVLAGEGVATRKYDGTCCMFDGLDWWARREVKDGKSAPPNFVVVNYDEATGKTMGWEPIEQSPFAKFHAEALANDGFDPDIWRSGTYELCGPKINGNPEGYEAHYLVHHADDVDRLDLAGYRPLTFESIRALALDLGTEGIEGIVWHHPDGRMAKIKARDFERTDA